MSHNEWEGLGAHRIKDPDKAHEMANMMSVEAKNTSVERGNDAPTVKDYEMALDTLERLEETAQKEDGTFIPLFQKLIQHPTAAIFGGTMGAIDLIGYAVLCAGSTVGMRPQRLAEEDRQAFVERFKKIGSDYKMIVRDLAPAREQLEKWKAEAEKLAQKQNEQ